MNHKTQAKVFILDENKLNLDIFGVFNYIEQNILINYLNLYSKQIKDWNVRMKGVNNPFPSL